MGSLRSSKIDKRGQLPALASKHSVDHLLTLESTRQRVQGDDDDDTGRNTRRRGPHTGLGLERRSRERPSGRVRVEECSQSVVDTDRDQLLVRVDLVPVESTERLGNGNVLKQEDDDGDGKFGGKGGEQRARDVRLTDVSQSRGNVAENGDRRLGFAIADTIRDGGGENCAGGEQISTSDAITPDLTLKLTNNKTMPETTEEERSPPEPNITVPSPLQPPLDEVKRDETCHPKRRVFGGEMQIFQSVDDNLEGFFPRVQAFGDTEQGGDLTGGDYKKR